MRCRRCEQDLPAGAMFCPHCGTPVGISCNSCSGVNNPGSKFCMQCGQPLDAQPATTATPLTAPTQPAPDAPAPASATAYESTPLGALACPRCHKVNEIAARYCYSCGLPLDETRKAALSASPTAQEAVVPGRPAGFWVRLVAFIIDVAVLNVAFFLLWPSIFGVPYVGWGEWFRTFDAGYGYSFDRPTGENLLAIFIQAAYFTLTTSLLGTTLGKRVFNLRVTGLDGRRLSMARALGRYFATWVSTIIIFIGYIMIGVRRDKRALHDLIAETWVVHK